MVNLWKIHYNENEKNNDEQTERKFNPTIPMDQWTVEIVQQWLEQFHIRTNSNFTGIDLLSKSDSEILQLFNNNEQLLNELSSLRHKHFVKQVASKKSNGVNLSTIPNEFLCPITQEIMHDPVCASDGYTYERKAIEEWLTKKQTSPIMNISISGTQLYPNKILKMLINKHMQNN